MKKIIIFSFYIIFFLINNLTALKAEDKIKTKEDLEAFLIGNEIKYSSMYEGKNYISTTKYDFDGKGYVIGSGMKQEIIWEAIDGNSIKVAYVQNMWWGWSITKLNYDNLTFTVTTEKTYDETIGDMVDKVSVYNGKILSPTIFAKKKLKKKRGSDCNTRWTNITNFKS